MTKVTRPNLDNFHMMGSNAYYYSGNLNKALDVAKTGIAVSDTNALLWNSYGMISTEFNDLKTAVKLIDGKFETEASGGINLKTAREYALCGVDYISVGALTHSVNNMDLSLKAI